MRFPWVERVSQERVWEHDFLLQSSAREDGFPLGLDQLPRALAEIVLGMAAGSTRLYAIYDAARDWQGCYAAGILQVDQGENLHLGPHTIFRRLYVRPESRMKGLAHALLVFALSDLAYPSWPVLAALTRPLPRLYARLGFKPLATTYRTEAADLLAHAVKWGRPGAKGRDSEELSWERQPSPSSEAVSRF